MHKRKCGENKVILQWSWTEWVGGVVHLIPLQIVECRIIHFVPLLLPGKFVAASTNQHIQVIFPRMANAFYFSNGFAKRNRRWLPCWRSKLRWKKDKQLRGAKKKWVSEHIPLNSANGTSTSLNQKTCAFTHNARDGGAKCALHHHHHHHHHSSSSADGSRYMWKVPTIRISINAKKTTVCRFIPGTAKGKTKRKKTTT